MVGQGAKERRVGSAQATMDDEVGLHQSHRLDLLLVGQEDRAADAGALEHRSHLGNDRAGLGWLAEEDGDSAGHGPSHHEILGLPGAAARLSVRLQKAACRPRSNMCSS